MCIFIESNSVHSHTRNSIARASATAKFEFDYFFVCEQIDTRDAMLHGECSHARSHARFSVYPETHWLKEVSEGSCAAMPLSLMLPLLLRAAAAVDAVVEPPDRASRAKEISITHPHPPQRPPFAQFATVLMLANRITPFRIM